MSERAGARPRMLFLCQTLPYPPDGGVAIRTYNVLKLLARTFDIRALCFFRASDRPTADDVRLSVDKLSEFCSVEAFPIPQEHDRIRYVADHVRSITRRRAYTLYSYESHAFRTRLASLLRQESYDVVHVDSLDLAGYLPMLSATPVVCVHHNVESELLLRRAAGTSNPLVRWYIGQQATLVERKEREWCGRVALNIAVSQVDARKISSIAPGARVAVAPNGVDTELFRPAPGREEGIIFVGGANWFPNRDALDYFGAEILPVVRRRAGAVPVRWVGRVPEELRAEVGRAHGIEMPGYVKDVRPLVHDAACYVVPLRVGGGTRLKILDAWALGKAVVTTSVGCEGLDAVDGVNALVRDTPASFAEAIVKVLEDRALRERLGRAGRATVEEKYAWDNIGRAMTDAYLDVMQSHGTARRAARSHQVAV